MKKILMLTSILILTLFISACNKINQSKDNINNTESPTAVPTAVPTTVPTVTLPADPGTQGNTTEDTLTVKDYYPFVSDAEYIYDGEGNEFAFYNRYTDFVDTANNRIQTRTNNGGTETVRVLEIKDGKLSVIKMVNECYYRDNIMDDTAAASDKAEVLLMEPLVKGTEWTLPDGTRRYISATDVSIETPSGTYQTIEVTTEGSDSTTKDYYAPNTGLVKSIFNSGDTEVTSTLKEIKTNTPYTQTIEIYYPDSDEKIHAEPLTLSFHTGDITRQVIQEALTKQALKENYVPLVSANTKINSLYLGDDKIAYVDFSQELVKEMHLGSGFEQAVLQCITNTLGNYYGTDEVYITVDGKPYESGHILMEKGETFKVNMDNIIR